MINSKDTVDEYIGGVDWRIKENANNRYSISGLKGYAFGKLLSDHALDIAVASDEHKSGAIHIHDLKGGMYSAYCCGHDLSKLLMKGLGTEGGVQSKPAKHLETVVHHMGEYLQIMSNEWEGAQAFSSVDSYLAPFVKEDNLSYREVFKCLQRLVYGLNFESRHGAECPFSNFSFDWTVQDDMKDKPCIVGGELMDYTYGDMQPYMDIVNEAFVNVMATGDSLGRPFSFPIPTYSVRDEEMFIRYDAKTKAFWELTAKFGSPYFSNYLGSGINPNTIRSMCCRLSLDLDEIREVASGIWDKGANTGSLAICTINLNRLGIESGSYKSFMNLLGYECETVTKQLIQRKDHVLYAFDNGLMPYTKEYIGRLDTFFLTIGVCGAWEAYVNLCRTTMDSVDMIGYEQFCVDALTIIKNVAKSNSTTTDWKLWNVEQTPAEGTSHRFARADSGLYSGAYVSGEGADVYLTNSTHVPVDNEMTIGEELKFRAKIDRMYTGGTLFNYYSDTRASGESVRKLMHNMCNKTALPYIAYTPSFGVCDEHGITYGSDKCVTCNEKIPYYSRVVGYFRSTDRFNNGQYKQFEERKYHSDK